jgi:acyl-CoA dehydrogenase
MTFNSPSVYFTDEHRMLRDQLRRFVESEIVPHGPMWEDAGMMPRDVLRKMGALGFLGLCHPAEYGGSGMDTLASVVLAEELGRSGFGGVSATVLVHTDMASPHIARFGSKAQHQRWMRKIVAGEAITAVAVTEPGAGSDVASMRTRATRDGNHFVINGTKMFITNGVHADLYFVAAKTDTAAKGSRGITMFVVEKGTPGFRVGQQLDKTGWLSSDTAELVFEDCRVDADAILGEENKGFYAIMRNFQNERVVMGAMAVAEAARAIEITLDYVKARPAFGGTLWDKQAIRQRLAALAARVEAGRQLVHHAAWLDAQGQDCVREVSMVKAYCGELVNEVLYACVQFHGGAGYMRGSAIERMARDARIHAIGGGATEVMLEEVAKRMEA